MLAALVGRVYPPEKNGRAMKNFMTTALSRSMKKAPIRGMTRNACTEGPNLDVRAVMLAMATGVAPSPTICHEVEDVLEVIAVCGV